MKCIRIDVETIILQSGYIFSSRYCFVFLFSLLYFVHDIDTGMDITSCSFSGY